MVRVNDIDGAAPADFYSTTNHRTAGAASAGNGTTGRAPAHGRRHRRRRRPAECRKLRDLKAGDRVVCGMQGIRVPPDLQARDKPTFGFMSNDVSSERRVEVAVAASPP